MTIDDILARLAAEGYEGCHVMRWSPKSIIVPWLGEVELAHGEAKIFDRKHPWPEYGDHPCTRNIDDLFADIHATWPLIKETPCETSSDSSPTSSAEAAEETATRDAVLALATADASDPAAVEPEGVQAGAEAPAVRVGVDDEPAAALGR